MALAYFLLWPMQCLHTGDSRGMSVTDALYAKAQDVGLRLKGKNQKAEGPGKSDLSRQPSAATQVLGCFPPLRRIERSLLLYHKNHLSHLKIPKANPIIHSSFCQPSGDVLDLRYNNCRRSHLIHVEKGRSKGSPFCVSQIHTLSDDKRGFLRYIGDSTISV